MNTVKNRSNSNVMVQNLHLITTSQRHKEESMVSRLFRTFPIGGPKTPPIFPAGPEICYLHRCHPARDLRPEVLKLGRHTKPLGRPDSGGGRTPRGHPACRPTCRWTRPTGRRHTGSPGKNLQGLYSISASVAVLQWGFHLRAPSWGVRLQAVAAISLLAWRRPCWRRWRRCRQRERRGRA